MACCWSMVPTLVHYSLVHEVASSILAMTLPGYFWDRWPFSADQLCWNITTTQVNSALHASWVAKSNTSFSWRKGGEVTASVGKKVKVNTDIAVRNRNYHTATGNHMPYGITQCYLPPGQGDFPAFTPAKAGTWFSDPGGMQGWVDLGGGYIST